LPVADDIGPATGELSEIVWDKRRVRPKRNSGPFSSWVRSGFGVVEDEDGLHGCGGAAWAAAQFGEDLPAFEGGHGAFADAADAGVGSVHGTLSA
jgi:hypothetical protein